MLATVLTYMPEKNETKWCNAIISVMIGILYIDIIICSLLSVTKTGNMSNNKDLFSLNETL